MKIIPTDIALRPGFQLDLGHPKEPVLQAFESIRSPPFIVSRSEEHVFIKFDRETNHFWSPQLHLEIYDAGPGSSRVKGLFGPNPTLWTFFMFLHFGVATLFVILGIWAYSSASLGRAYLPQMVGMGLLVAIWFVFYAFGRAGKKKGKPQMLALHTFMMQTIESVTISADSQTA